MKPPSIALFFCASTMILHCIPQIILPLTASILLFAFCIKFPPLQSEGSLWGQGLGQLYLCTLAPEQTCGGSLGTHGFINPWNEPICLIIGGPPAGVFHKYLSSVYHVPGTMHSPPMNRSDPLFPSAQSFEFLNPEGHREE